MGYLIKGTLGMLVVGGDAPKGCLGGALKIYYLKRYLIFTQVFCLSATELSFDVVVTYSQYGRVVF